MSRFQLHRILFFLLTGLTGLTSCVKETPDNFHSGAYRDVSFSLQLPQSQVIETRSSTEKGTADENYIENITLLAFQNDKLVFKNPYTPQSGGSDDLWEFTAKINVTGDCYLMLVANTSVTHNIDATREDVEKGLTVTQTEYWEVDKSANKTIPMWGEVTNFNTATADGTTIHVDMTRMVARVNVYADAVKDDFELESISYYNRNTAGRVVPKDVTKFAASLPDAPGFKKGEGLTYDNTSTANKTYIQDNICEKEIYAFEAAHIAEYGETGANGLNWTNNPCLIIGGKYKDGETTYYRLDFLQKTTENGFTTSEWMDVVRNYSYHFKITAVNCDGYASAGDALTSAPENMTIDMEVIKDENGETAITGPYLLSVSPTKVTAPSRGILPLDVMKKYYPISATNNSSRKAEVYDYLKNRRQFVLAVTSNYEQGWSIEVNNMTAFYDLKFYKRQGDTYDWEIFNPADKQMDVKTEIIVSFGENLTYTEFLNGDIYICAGRQKVRVDFEQTISINMGRFAGDLIEDNGVWRYSEDLYVREDDDSYDALAEWMRYTDVGWVVGIDHIYDQYTVNRDGKKNTYSYLTQHSKGADNLLAMNICFEQNQNHTGISGDEDADYMWFLPALNELSPYGLMLRELHTDRTFHNYLIQNQSLNYAGKATKQNDLWSSSEYARNSGLSLGYRVNYNYGIQHTTGGNNNKSRFSGVRCVRRVTPSSGQGPVVYQDGDERVILDLTSLPETVVTDIPKYTRGSEYNVSDTDYLIDADYAFSENERAFRKLEIAPADCSENGDIAMNGTAVQVQSWAEAFSLCMNSTYKGGGWRLPTSRETQYIALFSELFMESGTFINFNPYYFSNDTYYATSSEEEFNNANKAFLTGVHKDRKMLTVLPSYKKSISSHYYRARCVREVTD